MNRQMAENSGNVNASLDTFAMPDLQYIIYSPWFLWFKAHARWEDSEAKQMTGFSFDPSPGHEGHASSPEVEHSMYVKCPVRRYLSVLLECERGFRSFWANKVRRSNSSRVLEPRHELATPAKAFHWSQPAA
jgi:hypothetical protein